MIWAAIASLVMVLTGDGDDARAFKIFFAHINAAIAKAVEDPIRRDKAIAAIAGHETRFNSRRENMVALSKCIEAADRRHDATADDYRACREGRDQRWDELADEYLLTRADMRAALTVEEWHDVGAEVLRSLKQ